MGNGKCGEQLTNNRFWLKWAIPLIVLSEYIVARSLRTSKVVASGFARNSCCKSLKHCVVCKEKKKTTTFFFKTRQWGCYLGKMLAYTDSDLNLKGKRAVAAVVVGYHVDTWRNSRYIYVPTNTVPAMQCTSLLSVQNTQQKPESSMVGGKFIGCSSNANGPNRIRKNEKEKRKKEGALFFLA